MLKGLLAQSMLISPAKVKFRPFDCSVFPGSGGIFLGR